MKSIMISLKRFLKNKNTVTILAILLSLGILYWAYYYRIQKATEPVNVPYATRDLAPRTQITNDMVSVKKVPGGIVGKNVLLSTSEIVGKYVINTGVIPEGSIFYTDMVVTWDELPSSLFEDIPDGNTVVLMAVTTESTYGNSMYPGNYIDLYYVNPSGVVNGVSKLMLGKFIQSIKILAVVDSAGNNVFETIDSPKTPAYIMFSVPEDIHILLRKVQFSGGSLFPVPRNAEYSKNPGPTAVVSTEIKKQIERNTLDLKDVYGDANYTIIGGNN